MKKKQFTIVFKAYLLIFAAVAILSFSKPAAFSPSAQFHDNVASIVNGTGISQENLANMMMEAEEKKAAGQTASNFVEAYMNAHFKAEPSALFSTNRVSIASPGNPDQNQSVACNLTALRTVTSSTVGYYYAFATKCDGTYKYDGKNFTGGSTVYVRAEASTYILEAFILF